MNPNYTLQTTFPKLHFNITILFTSRSSEWSILFTISNQNFVRITRLPTPNLPSADDDDDQQ
jgi:hypothetical protein